MLKLEGMEVIKGKGLTAVSVVMIAIASLEIKLCKINFYGIAFDSNEEWKLLLFLSLAWLLFFLRYIQGFNEMIRIVNSGFNEYIIEANSSTPDLSIKDDDGSERRADIAHVDITIRRKMTGAWTYIEYSEKDKEFASEEEQDLRSGFLKPFWSIYLDFVLYQRTFLNYFLPIIFAFFGFVCMIINWVRILAN